MICFSTPFYPRLPPCCFEGRPLACRQNTMLAVHFMAYNDSRMSCFIFFPFVFPFFSPCVTIMWVCLSVDLPYWELQPYIKRAHSIQPSLSIICSLVLYHQCTVHSASFHAWNTHADPWDVSASLCNKLVLITCFLLLLSSAAQLSFTFIVQYKSLASLTLFPMT